MIIPTVPAKKVLIIIGNDCQSGLSKISLSYTPNDSLLFRSSKLAFLCAKCLNKERDSITEFVCRLYIVYLHALSPLFSRSVSCQAAIGSLQRVVLPPLPHRGHGDPHGCHDNDYQEDGKDDRNAHHRPDAQASGGGTR